MRHVAIYVRVSSRKQQHKSQLPDLQRWADSQSEPVRWYKDTATGKTTNRPGWKRLEKDIAAGRVSKLVCWKLDRLGRTARELLILFDQLRARRSDLLCVAGGVNGLETAEGRFMAGILAQVAEFDNELRSERIRAGQAAARASGKRWGGSLRGRRVKVTPQQAKIIYRMKHEDGESVAAIARTVALSRPTVYSVLAEGNGASL